MLISGCPITFDRHSHFSCPDPIGDPVPVKLDGVTHAHMRQPALVRPLADGLRMESQDVAHVFHIEQAGLAFEFFG